MTKTQLSKIPILRTERLTLRKLRKTDALKIFELYGSPLVMAFHTALPFTHIRQAQDLVQYHEDLFQHQQGIRWALTLHGHQELIGTCGFHNWRQFIGRAEISYELSPHYWRQGLMKEALAPIIEFGFSSMGLAKIRAKVMEGNLPSIKLLEAFHFVPDEEPSFEYTETGCKCPVFWFTLPAS